MTYLLITRVLLFLFAVQQSQQYEMEPITKSPYIWKKPDPAEVNSLIIDLLSQHSSTLLSTPATLSISDANSLCEAFGKDEDVQRALHGIRGFHFVPIYPMGGFTLPAFRFPCFEWIRKRCIGIAKPPFDYRCHYWSPNWAMSGSGCGADSRKKRSAGSESVVISGTEALTLCSTVGQLPRSKFIEFDTVALPTNEASGLRCMNWKLTDSGWSKQQLIKVACEQFNVDRPAGYIMNEVNDAVIEDLFSEIIVCGSRGKIVDCMFQKHNVRDPST